MGRHTEVEASAAEGNNHDTAENLQLSHTR